MAELLRKRRLATLIQKEVARNGENSRVLRLLWKMAKAAAEFPRKIYAEMIFCGDDNVSHYYFVEILEEYEIQRSEWVAVLEMLRQRLAKFSPDGRWRIGEQLHSAPAMQEMLAREPKTHHLCTTFKPLISPMRVRQFLVCDYCCKAIPEWTPETFKIPEVCPHRQANVIVVPPEEDDDDIAIARKRKTKQ